MKNLDRIASRAFAFILTASWAAASAPVAAAAAPPIYVNGRPTSVAAMVRRAQVFVPVRGVFEKLGAVVTYTPPRAVTAGRAGKTLVNLTVGSRTANVHGTTRLLQTAPFRSGARVFVPLRLISEAAGASVAYSTAPRAVRITSGRAVAAVPAVAAAAATAAPTPAAGAMKIPWWVWLLLALLLLAALFAMLRRRKPDPVIATRSTPRGPTGPTGL